MWVATLFMKYYVPVFDYISRWLTATVHGYIYMREKSATRATIIEHQIQSNFPRK